MTEIITTPEVEADEAMVLVQAQPMEKLFERTTIDPILEKIATHCRAVPRDMSTELGRKAIASLAYKITKTKTFIESQRTTLVSAEKKRLAAIDSEGKRIRDTLDQLRDEVREPLTQWEEAEKARVEGHEQTLTILARTDFFGTAEVQERVDDLARFNTSTMQEFRDRGEAIRLATLRTLELKLAECKKADAEREDLERLRKEKAERDQKDREARIAEDARKEAERRARQAEVRAKEAEERAKRAEREKAEASERAAAMERDRIAREQKAEADAAAKREANRKHRGGIHSAAMKALIQGGVPEKWAKLSIELIAKDKVPAIKIEY